MSYRPASRINRPSRPVAAALPSWPAPSSRCPHLKSSASRSKEYSVRARFESEKGFRCRTSTNRILRRIAEPCCGDALFLLRTPPSSAVCGDGENVRDNIGTRKERTTSLTSVAARFVLLLCPPSPPPLVQGGRRRRGLTTPRSEARERDDGHGEARGGQVVFVGIGIDLAGENDEGRKGTRRAACWLKGRRLLGVRALSAMGFGHQKCVGVLTFYFLYPV